MGPLSLWDRVRGWVAYLPVRLAYRLIWAAAKLGSQSGKSVHERMRCAGLAVPRLGKDEPPFGPGRWA